MASKLSLFRHGLGKRPERSTKKKGGAAQSRCASHTLAFSPSSCSWFSLHTHTHVHTCTLTHAASCLAKVNVLFVVGAAKHLGHHILPRNVRRPRLQVLLPEANQGWVGICGCECECASSKARKRRKRRKRRKITAPSLSSFVLPAQKQFFFPASSMPNAIAGRNKAVQATAKRA